MMGKGRGKHLGTSWRIANVDFTCPRLGLPETCESESRAKIMSSATRSVPVRHNHFFPARTARVYLCQKNVPKNIEPLFFALRDLGVTRKRRESRVRSDGCKPPQPRLSFLSGAFKNPATIFSARWVTVPCSERTETGPLVRAASERLLEGQSEPSCRYETMESSPVSPGAGL